jgi:tetratricopeptide (TPR) repeat protein
MFRLSSLRTSPLLALTVLLAAMLVARPVRGLSTGLGALAPEIETLYNAGSYSSAAEALQAAIAQNPTDASLYYWLGRCYFEARDFNRSISNWERAVALDSNRSEFHDWLGRAYGRKAEEDSHSKMASALSLARRTHHEFELAVQLDAKNVDARRDLISFMASAPRDLGGGEEQAMAQIHELSSVDSLEGMLALADLYATRKKFDLASQEYQQILKSAPDRLNAYFETADYYRDRDDSEHMQQAVEGAQLVTLSDRRLSYYVGVSLVLAKKDAETAEKDLRSYIDSVPDNSELPSHSSAYQYLGKLYENQGRSGLAVEQYKTALALDPQNKSARESLKRLGRK